MADPLTLSTSCGFTRTISFFDEILTSLWCLSMNKLLWVMNYTPKMHSISPKVETNKSTFPPPIPSWRSTFLACNVVGWGTPSPKCTSLGALSSSNWSSIFSTFLRVMKLWEAFVSKTHNTSSLKIFPFRKIRKLCSCWARLMIRAITLEPPFPNFGLRQFLD